MTSPKTLITENFASSVLSGALGESTPKNWNSHLNQRTATFKQVVKLFKIFATNVMFCKHSDEKNTSLSVSIMIC